MKAFQGLYACPLLHGLNIFGIYSHPITAHNVNQVFHLRNPKITFGGFHQQLMVMKEFQNLRYNMDVSLQSFTINQYVIKENQDKVSKICLQVFIHEALKGEGRITK